MAYPRFSWASLCLASCCFAACAGGGQGFGIDVTIRVDATVDDDVLTSVTELVLSAMGDENGSFPVSLGRQMMRTERVFYVPQLRTRMMELSISARTAEGDEVAKGTSTTIALEPGKTSSTTVDLLPVTSMVDMSIPTDVGTNADGSTDGGFLMPTMDGGMTPPSTAPCRAFTMPSTDTLFASKKKVFARYTATFPLSIDNKPSSSDYYNVNYLQPSGESNKWQAEGGFVRQRPLPVAPGTPSFLVTNYEREIELAIGAGITGFLYDVTSATDGAAGSELATLLQAAAAVDSRFEIVVMPDTTALASNATSIENIVKAVATNPAAYRLSDGRLVVAAWNAGSGSEAFWSGVLNDLKAASVDVAFWPIFNNSWMTNATAFAPISYAFGEAANGTTVSFESGEATDPATAHTDGVPFATAVASQYYRPSVYSYDEANNNDAFRAGWSSAITGGADFVALIGWNDFGSSTEIAPYTDETLSPTIGTGFYSMNSYYASWYLTGVQPTITHDVLYWFYRREPTTAPASAQMQATLSTQGTPSDQIEVVAFLTAQASVGITIGGVKTTKLSPAGVSTFAVPLQKGTPTFSLSRSSSVVFSFQGQVPIVDQLSNGTLDLTYWSGSASADGICSITVPAAPPQ